MLVRKGTPGLVRKVGGKWRPFKATKNTTFIAGEYRPHSGGYLIFSRKGWEFMVLERHLTQQKGGPTRYGTFNRSILGRNGKGANRRRMMKRIRRQR